MLLSLSVVGAVAFLVALVYVVYNSPRYFIQEESSLPLFEFLDAILDLMDAISRNRSSFFFTVVINFILLYGIFSINICSTYLAELAKSLEQRRTGGRETNEVELGKINTDDSVVRVEKKVWGVNKD